MQSSILHPSNYTFWAENQTYYNQYAPWYAAHLEVFRNASCFTGTADIVIPATRYVLPYEYTYESEIGVLNAKIPTIEEGDSVWFVNPFNQTACLWKDGNQKKDLTCIGGGGCLESIQDKFGGPYDRAVIVATPDGSQAVDIVSNGARRTKLGILAVPMFAIAIIALVLE